MLPNTKHRHFILALAYTSANWNEDTGGEQTDEKVFDAVKAVFDAVPGKRLGNLVPDLSCWFDEVAEGGVEEQRSKYFTFFFSAKWALEVRFEVEKLRQASPHDRILPSMSTSSSRWEVFLRELQKLSFGGLKLNKRSLVLDFDLWQIPKYLITVFVTG